MAEYTDFGFMRPEETEGGDGPIKQFFQNLFNRKQGGLVGDAPARLVKNKEPDDTNPYGFRIHTAPKRNARNADPVSPFNPTRRATPNAITDGEKKNIDEDERQRMLAYMRHPSYKERLKKEIFYDSFNPNDKSYQQTVDDEYNRRIQDMESIPISRAKFSTQRETEMPYGQYFPWESYHHNLPGGVKGPLGKKPFPQIVMGEDTENNEVNINPNLYRQVLGHELGHASHAGSLSGWAYNRDQKKIPYPGMVVGKLEKHAESPLMQQKMAVREMMSPEFMQMPKRYQNKTTELAAQKIGPEKVQQIIESQKRMNAEYEALKKEKGRKYAQEKGPNWNSAEFNNIQNNHILDHLDQNDTEVATRMIGLRRLAAEKFGHDMNEDFDIKKYKPQIQEYFKKNGMIDEYNQLNKTLELSDDQINEMMKYIARRTPSQQQTGRYTG